jgi:hypothetical protein
MHECNYIQAIDTSKDFVRRFEIDLLRSVGVFGDAVVELQLDRRKSIQPIKAGFAFLSLLCAAIRPLTCAPQYAFARS